VTGPAAPAAAAAVALAPAVFVAVLAAAVAVAAAVAAAFAAASALVGLPLFFPGAVSVAGPLAVGGGADPPPVCVLLGGSDIHAGKDDELADLPSAPVAGFGGGGGVTCFFAAGEKGAAAGQPHVRGLSPWGLYTQGGGGKRLLLVSSSSSELPMPLSGWCSKGEELLTVVSSPSTWLSGSLEYPSGLFFILSA